MLNLKKEDLSMKEENKEDFKMSVIERKNLTNEFTVHSIETHLKALRKMKKEVDATVSMARSMLGNIEKNHGKLIKNTSAEHKATIWLWQENTNMVKENEPNQKQVDEEITKHEEYLDVIYKTFGFVKVVENPNDKIKRG